MADARRPQGPAGPLGPRPTRVFDERTPQVRPRAPMEAERSGGDGARPEGLERPRPRDPGAAISDSPEDRQRKQRSQATLLGEGRIGDDTVTAPELAAMGSSVAARHLMVLLAKKRADRSAALASVGDLLLELGQPTLVRRLLMELPDAGRIVDIYPLEVLAYVLERRPELLDGFDFAPFVENKAELEAQVFEVEAAIRLRLPLALRLRAFALDGGGTPGYCLAPGAPGEYILELGEAGTFSLLLRGELRKKSLIDRLQIRVVEPPEEP